MQTIESQTGRSQTSVQKINPSNLTSTAQSFDQRSNFQKNGKRVLSSVNIAESLGSAAPASGRNSNNVAWSLHEFDEN